MSVLVVCGSVRKVFEFVVLIRRNLSFFVAKASWNNLMSE